MSVSSNIITELKKIYSSACALLNENPICPEQSGIAYQDIPHFQTTIYREGDEGYRVTNGLMDQNNPAFPLYIQRLDLGSADPFNTLFYDNVFGTRDRFTDIDGLQVYGGGITVDHLTKRMYTVGTVVIKTWGTAMDESVASVVGGFTDWYAASLYELTSLYNYETITNSITITPYPDSNSNYWTSTTARSETLKAILIAPAVGAGTPVVRTFTKSSSVATINVFTRIFNESELNIP